MIGAVLPGAVGAAGGGGAFIAVSGAALSTQIESNVLTISAAQAGAITITGGQYSKNGGSYTGMSGTVAAGDTVRLRVTSSASNSTAVTATATINGVAYAFVVTTLAAAMPTLTLSASSFNAGASAGTLIGNIGNVPSGSTPTFAPGDGRVAIAGNEATGWKLVVGLTASSAGTISGTISAAGANPLSVSITVNDVSAATPNPLWLGDAIDDFTNTTSPGELNGRLAGPSGQWTANSNGLWQTYTESNSLGSIIRQVNFNAAGPAKLINTLDPTDGWGADLLYEVDWTAEYTTDPGYTGDATDANLPTPTSWTIYNTGTTDYISLTLDLTLNRLTVTPRVDGTSLTAKAWSFTSPVFAKGGRAKLTFLVRNACVWVAINGVWWDRWSYSGITAQPRNYADLRDDFPLAKRKGVITFENASRRNPRAMGVAVALKAKVTIADDNGYKPILTPSVSNATGADTPQSHTITWEGPEPPCFFGQVTRTAGGGSTSAQGVMRIYPATILTRDRFGGTAQIDWLCPPDSTLYDADSDGTPETPEGAHQLQITYNAMPLFHAAKQLSDTHSEVIIRGTYDGTPEAWFVQVFDGDRGTLTGDPAFTLQQVTPTKAANGQYELRVNVPIALRTYVAHVSYNESGKRFGAYSRRFICGHQVEIFGQSNASGRANATWSGTADPASLATSYVYPLFGANYTSTAQYLNYAARPNDTFTRNTMWEMARVLTEKTGMPWAVFHSGHGGSPMYSFLSTSSGGAGSVNYHELLARRAAAGNRASVMIVDQGEAEAASPFASEAEGWHAETNQMLEEVRALYGNPTLKCGVTAIGKYASDQFGGTGPISSGRGYARMRAQQYSMPSRYPDKFFMSTWRGGEGRSDQLHFNAAGHQEDCQKGAYSILASVLGQSIPDGMGPAITGATRTGSGTGAYIDLDVDLRGYDSITGSAITGYLIQPGGTGAWVTPTSVEIVSGKIRISDDRIVAGTLVRSYDNWDWSNGIAWPGGSDSSMARGVEADGRTNVPVQPIIGSWSGSTYTDAGLLAA